MDFLDKVRIVVKAGNGGDGCAAFHREKFVMKGGPSGGDGGNGGSVVFYADPRLNTLLPFRFQRFYRAENGGKGLIELKRGKDGEDMVIHVPVGTVVRDLRPGRQGQRPLRHRHQAGASVRPKRRQDGGAGDGAGAEDHRRRGHHRPALRG